MTRISTAVDVSNFTTDAKFRAWGLAISTSLAAAGLVQTADTGQVDWATVTKPTTVNTAAGYEIWRFNDSLQGAAPVFIKLLYCSGPATSGNSPAIAFIVGQGSNGSGTITGTQTTQLNSAPLNLAAGNSTNVAMTMLFTHTEGYMLAYSAPYSNTSLGYVPMFFAIDRTRDQSTGEPTAEGLLIFYAGLYTTSKTIAQAVHLSFEKGNYFGGTGFPMMPPGDQSSFGGRLFPVFSTLPEPKVAVGFVGVMASDAADFSTFTAKPIGTTITHTYITLYGSSMVSSLVGTDTFSGMTYENNIKIAFLWED